MSEYEDAMNYLMSAKSVGKRTVFYKGKIYSIDNNFNPPIVKEIMDGQKENR